MKLKSKYLEKTEKVDKPDKGDKNLSYDSQHSSVKFRLQWFKEMSLDSKELLELWFVTM